MRLSWGNQTGHSCVGLHVHATSEGERFSDGEELAWTM